jgi:hypothetical protein
MVTPRKRLTIEDDGKAETLVPGRDRLSVDHEFVTRHPEKFVACWSRDVHVRRQLVELRERAQRRASGPRSKRAPDTASNYGLGAAPRTTEASWRL